jgi:hypothetical protein
MELFSANLIPIGVEGLNWGPVDFLSYSADRDNRIDPKKWFSSIIKGDGPER